MKLSGSWIGRVSVMSVVCAAGLAARASDGQVGAMVGDDIVQFYANADAERQSLPSYALVQPRLDTFGEVPEGWGITPEFFTEDDRTGFHIDIDPGTSLYGTGEVPGPLLRNGRTQILWNTDAYGYKNDSPSLYKSFPWVLAVRKDGSAFGVIANTSYKCEVDLTDGIRFAAPGEPFGAIVIERDTPQQVVMALTDLTGRMPLPPKWSIGYHQCRYSYEPDDRVLEVAKGFRDRNIPADVIWMDIDYMHKYLVFTFDEDKFPDPKGLNETLMDDYGFHNVWMIDPGIGILEESFPAGGYPIVQEMIDNKYYVRDAEGGMYVGEVWPGPCIFPDYSSPEVREWWAGLYQDFMAQGITGVWNDMNEPAVFNVSSKTMPEDNLHFGEPEMGGEGTHARYHNLYGTLMVQATREGIQRANPDKRPFVLSRAIHLGAQRFAAGWSGDNSADWFDLDASVSMVLNMGLSGFPNYGPDIGGFNGNGDARLFERWIGLGAFLPFSRGHTGKGNIDKEPWAFDAETETTARQALENRYILLPHLYTAFWEASETGLPVARPLFFIDPTDMALRAEDDAFMLGDGLLIKPSNTPHNDREPVLPEGTWRQLKLQGAGNPDVPTLHVQEGHIIPMGPIRQFVGEKKTDPLTLAISLDKNGTATGRHYTDAGDGYDYLDGVFRLETWTATTDGDTVTVELSDVKGTFPQEWSSAQIRVLLDDGTELTDDDSDGVLSVTLP